jgi:CheY-like chemotaxis protein
MRIRKLLLVHPARSKRGLIKKYIFSELSDIDIFEAQSGSDAVAMALRKQFDVIIAADELKDMSVSEFKAGVESVFADGDIPLIIISESESIHVRNELVEQGFDRVVQIRIRPSDLIDKINAVCNPRTWRKDARYHIPDLSVEVGVDDRCVGVTLINISRGGLLVELDCEQPQLLMGEQIQITLVFPIQAGRSRIDGLTAHLSRIEVLDWHPAGKPKQMRATFIFYNLPEGSQRKLDELLQMAKTEKLNTAETDTD